MGRFLLVACALALLIASPRAAQQSGTAVSPPATVIRAGRMVDPRTGTAVQNVTIVIEGARIRAAGANATAPDGARIIDLGTATVLPGLIDSHTHLLQNYNRAVGSDDPNMILTVAQLGTARRVLLGAAMAREDLEAGITTVRDLGNSGWNGDVALRDAINAGWVVGPRIVASTRALSAAGGQFGGMAAEAQRMIENEYAVISGVEEARRAVRQALYDGADCIKVIVNTGPRIVSLDEMKVIVDEAHRVNRKVAAHAIGNQATRIAVDAGVDSIEHAYTVPDDVLKDMAAKKIFLVPTDGPLEEYLELFVRPNARTPQEFETQASMMRNALKGSRDRLARAIKAGVPIAAGSDMYYDMGPGRTRGEASLSMFRAYLEAGMTPAAIIKAATVSAAELLGRETTVGVIEPGKLADIIAVDGDPLTDITLLEKVKFVMKGGQVYKNTLTAAPNR